MQNSIKSRLIQEFESYRAVSMAAGRHALANIANAAARGADEPEMLRMLDELVADLKALADDFGREGAYAINTADAD